MADYRKERIKAIAVAIVTGKAERGEIPLTYEAIKEATREAVKTATAAFDAAEEFICG